MTGTPIIITGIVKTLTSVPWNFQHIKEVKNHSLSMRLFKLGEFVSTTQSGVHFHDLKLSCIGYSFEVNHYVLAEIKIQQVL